MIEQTTLHNILTWVIAVILFIFQSLNYFFVRIKKYVKHGKKTTTVVTADTTISSESNRNNNNAPENVITVQGLIQKHFDIPLIIAEDEPKVNNFVKSAQLLTSNEFCNEKKKIDQFMENLVDDSYVARGLGLITATVGRQSEFYLYSKYDNNFENVVIRLKGRNGEIGQITLLSQNLANNIEIKSIPMDYFYDEDRIKVTYTPFAEGVYTLTLVRNSLSICRSPYYISVEKSPTNSRSQIRLGTKKYKPVTKFTKAKHASLESFDNSISVIEPSKPSICRNILPKSEENSIRTDVMSIVTKFESNNLNVQKRVHKRTSSISETGPETDLIDENSTYSNIQSKIETDKHYDTNVSDLISPSIHTKSKFTDKKCWNDLDININAIDAESDRIKIPMTKLNESIIITNDIPPVKNIPSTQFKPTNSVLVDTLHDGNSHDIMKHNQTFKTTELIEENNHIETLLDPTTIVDKSEIKSIDNESYIKNEVSCFDDDDRKTVVLIEKCNDMESNPNDTVIQQITDSAQYNINTPFASVITKITDSICEKCSIQVFKILSEFPRDINITHNNNSNEIRPSFETLLAQPISININIDNLFEYPISATSEYKREHLQANSPTNIKNTDTTDKDIKCNYLNEIEPIDNSTDELYSDFINTTTELMIKENKHNNEITTNEENVLGLNKFNNNTIHKSDDEMEIEVQNVQKPSEDNKDLTNQFHKNIKTELNNINRESYLETINYDKNTSKDLVTDKFKIKNVIVPNENTSGQSSVINNTLLAPIEVTLATSEYKSEDNEQQTNNISYENVILTSIQDENQKLIIEKSIEPILHSFKNKMVEKITQLYLNKNLSKTDYSPNFETHDRNLTNSLQEIQINNNVNNTEINTKCIKTLTSQLQSHIDKNEISEIILDKKKTDNNHLFKYVENLIKTNMNSNEMHTKTLGEKKLQTLVNITMNHPIDQQIDNEFNKSILENKPQDTKLNKTNNGDIVQDIETELEEISSVTQIKNTNELTSSEQKVTVKNQCKMPLLNDFDTIEINNTNADIKQEMQVFNVNKNVTIVEINKVEIKALQNFQKSDNTGINTPIIELQPPLETQIMNISELVTVEEHSSKEIQSTIETIESNIPEETDEVEDIDDKNEYESEKLKLKENKIIKIPYMVKKATINEIVENTNTTTKSNSTENVSMQQTKKQKIESSDFKKVYDANVVTLEKESTNNLPPLNNTENIIIENPNSQIIIPTLPARVSKNAAKVTIGIKTSDTQFPNTTVTVLIPSKNPSTENNSIIQKLRLINSLNEFDTIEILTIPKDSTTCDTQKATIELKNTLQSTLFNNTNKLCMKNNKIEKTENTDETLTPSDTEIETFKYLNKSEKQISIPPLSNDTSPATTIESKNEKYNLYKTLNLKYNLTNLEPTVNEINCYVNKNDTTKTCNSSAGVMVEQTIEKNIEIETSPLIDAPKNPEIKLDEMFVPTETEISTLDDRSTASLVQKIVVEFVSNKNKTPIESLEIIVRKKMQQDVEKVIYDESLEPNLSLGELVLENCKANIDTEILLPNETIMASIEEPTVVENVIKTGINSYSESPTVTEDVQSIEASIEEPIILVGITETRINACTESSKILEDVQTDVEKVIDEESLAKFILLSKEMGKNTKVNIDADNEILLPNDTVLGSIEETKVLKDIIEIGINPCSESPTVTEDVQSDVEKVIDEESLAPNILLSKKMEENTKVNIDIKNEILLPNEKIIEPIKDQQLVEDVTENDLTHCTENSTEIEVVQPDIEKNIEDELLESLNSSEEIVLDIPKGNIDTDNKIILPNETLMGSIEELKVLDDVTQTGINPCITSSTVTGNMQSDEEKVIEDEPVPSHNSSEEVVLEISKRNIDTEQEILLPNETIVASIEEPKMLEDITETGITPCTGSFAVTEDEEQDAEKLIYDESTAPNISLSEEVGENTKVNVDLKKEILLPNEKIIESIEYPKLAEDVTETEIIPYIESSAVTEDLVQDAEKVIYAESTAPNILLSEEEGENTKVNIVLVNDLLLQNEKIIASMEEKKVVENVTETEINPYTESFAVTEDMQPDTEKKIEDEPVKSHNSSEEVVLDISKGNIDTDNENILLNETLMGSTEELKVLDDVTQTGINPCTAFSTVTVDVQPDVEKVIDEKSLAPNISLSEDEGDNAKVNIDTENEIRLTNENIIVFIEDPKVVEDITETRINPCTESSTIPADMQPGVEKVIDGESFAPNTLLSEEMGKNTKVNIDTDNEIFLPNDTVLGSIEETKVIKDIIETGINPCSESPTVTEDVQSDVEKVIYEESLAPNISFSEEEEDNTMVNIDTENEILLPNKIIMAYIEEPKVVENVTETGINPYTESFDVTEDLQPDTEKIIEDEPVPSNNSSEEVVLDISKGNIDTENEKILLNETLKGSTEELKVLDDVTQTGINPCTASSTVNIDVQQDVERVIEKVTEKVIDDESLVHNISLGELVLKISKANIDTENEIHLSNEKIMAFIEKPKVLEDIIETRINPCTESSTIPEDVPPDVEKVIYDESTATNISLSEEVREYTKVDINTDNEILLPNDTVLGSIEKTKEVKNIIETRINNCSESATVTEDVQSDVEKVIDEKSLAPNISLSEKMEENTKVNIDIKNEILLPNEKIIEPPIEDQKLVEDVTESGLTSCTENSTEIEVVQPDIEKNIENELLESLNSSEEVLLDISKGNIDTDNKIILPNETLMGSIEELKVQDDVTQTGINLCITSSTVTGDMQSDEEKVIEDEPIPSNNSAEEVLLDISKGNIDKENEILLPNETIMASIEEPKILEDITEKGLTPCTRSSLTDDVEQDAEKVIYDESTAPNISLSEEVRQNTKVNVDLKNEILLPNEKIIESIEDLKLAEDVTETEINFYTESFAVTEDVQPDAEKVIYAESTAPNISLSEEEGENTKVNVVLVNDLLLQNEKIIASIEEPKLAENVTETEINPYTKSFAVSEDVQPDTEKIIEDEPIPSHNSSEEVVLDISKGNIDTENEKILLNETLMGSTEELKVLDDVTQTGINQCTASSTVTGDMQSDEVKVIKEESLASNISLGDFVLKMLKVNIDTENQIRVPNKTIMASIKEPKILEDITEKGITPCTGSSAVTEDVEQDAENIIYNESAALNISLGEEVGENTKVNVDLKNEKRLPNEKIIESIEYSKLVEDVPETAINPYIRSSAVTEDVQPDTEKLIEDESLPSHNLLEEVVLQISKGNIDTENEILLPNEKIMAFIEEPIVLVGITETRINPCTDSSTILEDVQTDVGKVIYEESLAPNISSQDMGENTKVNIFLVNNLLLQNEKIIASIEEPKVLENVTETEINSYTESKLSKAVTKDVQLDTKKIIEDEPAPSHNSSEEVVLEILKRNIDTEHEILLPNETIVASIEKPIILVGITETRINACTESSTILEDVQTDVEKVIDVESLAPIILLSEEMGENTKVNIDADNEILLPNDTVLGSIEETKVLKDIIEIGINPCSESPTVTEDVQSDVEKVIDEESLAPNILLSEEDGSNTKVNIDTENEILLPNENIIAFIEDKKVVEDTTETGITPCTESPIVTEDMQQGIEKMIEDEPLALINLSEEVVLEYSKGNIDTENEILLPNDTQLGSIEELIVLEGITETKINPCTESSTILEDVKPDVEKVIDEESLAPKPLLSEEIRENTIVNINADNEILLPSDTVLESIEEPKVLKDVMETPFSESPTVTEDVQSDVEKVIREDSLAPNISLCEEVRENSKPNIDTNNDILLPNETIMASILEPKVIKIETAMNSSVGVVEEQMDINVGEVVLGTCKQSLDYSLVGKNTQNETLTQIDILTAQTELRKVTKDNTLMLADTSTSSVEEQIKIVKVTETDTTTLIGCEDEPEVESNKIKIESENITSTLFNYSDSATKEQTKVDNLTEKILPNDNIMNSNTKTVLIERKINSDNLDNPNNCYLKFGETSRMQYLENEGNLEEKSYGIQKLEMSVERMRTSNEDYYEKTFVQLEQTEKISKVDKDNVDGENKTTIDDKLYTVNESDLNAILCASSLEEALTLLDSKIKFKFKHKKSSSKINSAAYIPKIQTSDSRSSDVNTNFTDAREFFKEIEKKSKK